jgi:Family of unknown function (DUF6494)
MNFASTPAPKRVKLELRRQIAPGDRSGEIPMNEEALNLSIRKFLKMVGISSQREIEHAVAKAEAAGAIKGSESFPAKMTLEVPGLKISVEFNGDIAVQ